MLVGELMLELLKRDPNDEVFVHADSPGRAQIHGSVKHVAPKTPGVGEVWIKVAHEPLVDPTNHRYIDPRERQKRRDWSR